MSNSLQPVRVITDEDLIENGGSYKLVGGPAMRVRGYSELLENFKPTGGPPINVYVVTDRSATGGDAIPVFNVTDLRGADESGQGNIAYPVYVANSDDWPSSGPTWFNDSGNITSCVGAWQAKGAESYDVSLLDLTGNGNDLTVFDGPVAWTTEAGWDIENSQAFDTGIVPTSQAWTYLFQIVDYTQGTMLMGITEPTNAIYIRPNRNGNSVRAQNGDGGEVSVLPQHTTGNIGIAGNRIVRDGVVEGPNLAAWSGGVTTSMTIGAQKFGTSYINGSGGVIVAVAIYNVTLSAPDLVTVVTAMAAL